MRPDSEAELAEMVRTAQEPLWIMGGGTRRLGQMAQGHILETGGMSGIVLHEPGALTLVARAGTPLALIEAELAQAGQRLAFEPSKMARLHGRSGETTIGGIVAANASGPGRIQGGACRDSLIGVRFVDGQGYVIKSGGRVMKNVTGYDLVKLMAGSHGTLGVLTEVSFKLLPKSEASATLRLDGLADAEAIAALSRALGSPFEVNGAAHLPGVGTFLRLEGFAKSVAYRSAQLRMLLGGDVMTDGAEALWADIRDVAPFWEQAGDVWRISTKPSEAATLGARLGAEAVFYDWGGGLIWARMAPGTDVRARMGSVVGYATLIRASAGFEGTFGHFAPEPAPVAALSAGLRAKFDPKSVLNPGLMG